MKSSELSISNQILSPMIKSRGNTEVIAKLEQEPNPILFETHEEVRIWFEFIWRKQINDRIKTPESTEEFALYQAIRGVAVHGNVKLVSLLQPEEKLMIRECADEHTVKSESDILRGLTKIFGTNRKVNAKEYNYSNGKVNVSISDISYDDSNESEMFLTEGHEYHPETTELSLKGMAAYSYLGSLSFPQEKKYEEQLGTTLTELYQLPYPKSHQFIAFKILADYDFTVMVERKVWNELERVLKPDKLHRILPKHTDYYYSSGHWDRHNKLVKEIETVITDEEIKESEKDQFFEKLIALRDQFRKELETSFNFRNSLIYERFPFVYGLILRHKYRKPYRIIKKDIQDLIKTRHISDLKV